MDPTPPPELKPAPPLRRRPAWLIAVPVLALLVGVIVAAVWVTRARKEAGLAADSVLPVTIQLASNVEVKFSDVTMQGRQKGVQRWMIVAPTVSLSKDSRYTYFEPKPKGRFLNLKDWRAREEAPSDKVRSLDWQADRAQFDSFSDDLEMAGHVVITTDDKDVIKTDKMTYKSRTKRVQMPGKVHIKMTDGTEARADSLEANSDAEVFELKGHVDFKAPTGDEEKL
ncbi:MAG: LPS export ABC transporter periplasmic protein LptC [Candidatus Sericytochromatia bacterium]|nr:LPS export ABC transporter periplasmic protein LptC [Candidatus Sericytochromatia bacterium]